MSKFVSFLKLIRLQNLFILFLAQVILYYFIYENFGDIKLYLLLIITFLITAAGYIINDIFDIKADKINKEEVIIGIQIPARQAIFWYYFFNSISLLLALVLLYISKNILLFLILLLGIFVLRWYSKTYKHKFLIGNLMVSVLTSLSIFNIYLISPSSIHDLVLIINKTFSDFSIASIDWVGPPLFIILIYCYFAFFLTFCREIVKDLEDKEGDKIMNSSNITFKISKKKIKGILIILLLFVLIPFVYALKVDIEYFLRYNFLNQSTFISSLIINLLVCFTIYNILKSTVKKDYTFISRMLKIIMFVGILTVPFYI